MWPILPMTPQRGFVLSLPNATWHRCIVALVLLPVLAGCAIATNTQQRTPSGVSASASWRGTDLLWDAISGPTGFTAVGNSGVVVTSPNGQTRSEERRVGKECRSRWWPYH